MLANLDPQRFPNEDLTEGLVVKLLSQILKGSVKQNFENKIKCNNILFLDGFAKIIMLRQFN